MKTEAEFKKLFCDSVKKQGGYTLRLAAPLMSGLPDIYCNMPGYCPLLLEAKFIKGLSGEFKRKIGYSKLQLNILRSCWDANPYTAFCLMGVEHENILYWSLLEPSLEAITKENLSNGFFSEFYDIRNMLYAKGVPEIR